MFVSYNFIAVLVLSVGLYYTVFKKYQWQYLLFLSIVFYFSQGREYLLYMFVVTTGVYFAGLEIDRHSGKKRYLYIGLLCSLGVLIFAKYTNFLLAGITSLFNSRYKGIDILLPLGISFYTFKSISYLVDVYQGKYRAERNFLKFTLYISFFPEIIQGPISRFDVISKTLFITHKFSKKSFIRGLYRVMWGYMKKMIVADRLLPLVTTIVTKPSEYNGVFVFAGAALYAVELYADFTGGIDITLGIAEFFGIKLEENFIRPYFSKSVKEYWTRWHITMGTWFRDYVFYPVSVSNIMMFISGKSKKIFGNRIGRKIPVYISTIIVWFLTGLWHGAGLNFIAWGLLNGTVILISNEMRGLYRKFHSLIPVKRIFPEMYTAFTILRTILIMSTFRMLDCYGDVIITFRAFLSIFTIDNWNLIRNITEISEVKKSDLLLVFISIIIMFFVSFLSRNRSLRDLILEKSEFVWYIGISLMFIVIIVFGTYGIGYDSLQFIYNRY